MKRSQIEALSVAVVFAVGTWFWVKVYVQPADEMRYSIIECMNGDNSREAYNDCTSALQKESE